LVLGESFCEKISFWNIGEFIDGSGKSRSRFCIAANSIFVEKGEQNYACLS
jgi:hypothetical protein